MSSAPLPPVSPLPPPSQPPRTNNALWWVLGIVGGALVILMFFALTVAGLVLRHLHINHSGKKVAIETPVGSIQVNKGEPHATGLPLYPGADPTNDNSNSIQIGTPDSEVGLATEEYRTGDSIDKVEDWYRKRLGPDFRLETETHADSHYSKKHGLHMGNHDVAFVDDHGDAARVIALDTAGGRTKITLLRVGKREPQ
jgi:hypothetical protein